MESQNKSGKKGEHMKIYINANCKNNGISNDNDTRTAFFALIEKLENDGYSTGNSRKLFDEGRIILAAIEEGKQLTIRDTRFVGYMFCSAFKGKYPLSPKSVLQNYNELVINQNEALLSNLYEEEFREEQLARANRVSVVDY